MINIKGSHVIGGACIAGDHPVLCPHFFFYPPLYQLNKLTAVAGAAVEKKRIREVVLKFFSYATFCQMADAANKIGKYSGKTRKYFRVRNAIRVRNIKALILLNLIIVFANRLKYIF